MLVRTSCYTMQMVPKLCDLSKNYGSANRANGKDYYKVIDLSGPREADLRNAGDLELLTRSISSCITCGNGQTYPTKSKALDHLLKCHFDVSAENSSNLSDHWIMNSKYCLNFQCRQDGFKILDAIIDTGTVLEPLASHIQHGVSVNGVFDKDTYRVPASLLDAFRYLLMTVIYAAHIAQKIYENRVAGDAMDFSHSFTYNTLFLRLEQCSSYAEEYMESAKSQIVLMTYTDDFSDMVSYEAVSPELVLGLVMGDARCRDHLGNKVDLLEIYRDYMVQLVSAFSYYLIPVTTAIHDANLPIPYCFCMEIFTYIFFRFY